MRNQTTRAAVGLMMLLGVAFGLSACQWNSASGSFTPANDNVLTVMTQPMPTAGFWEGTAEHPTGGFEYALAEELAGRLGLDGVDIQTEDFSDIVSGDLKDADIAMSLLTPTSKREGVLDFTTPYLQSPPVLLTRAGTEIPDVETAKALQFAVGTNTTFQDIVDNDLQPDLTPYLYEDRTKEIQAVRSGKANVAMFDLPAALAIVKDDPKLTIASRLAKTEPIAVALPLGSSNVDAVGSELRAMETDGTIDDLSEEWLGQSVTDSANSISLLRTSP